MFRRDEIDLLEEEIDDLYKKHGGSSKTLAMSAEVAVLREQRDTEEQAETDLALKLSLRGINPVAALSPTPLCVQEEGLGDRPSDQIRAHPMYQFARAWACALREVAGYGYETHTKLRKDFFRVYANANLVPIKIFTALCEGSQEDKLGLEVAQEAFELAVVYMGRIQESLTRLRQDPLFVPFVDRLTSQRARLDIAVQTHLAQLKRRRGFL